MWNCVVIFEGKTNLNNLFVTTGNPKLLYRISKCNHRAK